jgi:hypothetical protein
MAIKPGHKVELAHVRDGADILVVLLTTMPGDCCKLWRIPAAEYWQLNPKHGTRDRYIRENRPPTLAGAKNQRATQSILQLL